MIPIGLTGILVGYLCLRFLQADITKLQSIDYFAIAVVVVGCVLLSVGLVDSALRWRA